MNKEITKEMLRFDVTFYDSLEKINSVISKCRVRIFYKGLNRNRTFITDDFAEQLIASLPYVPIKGIFDKEDMDFEGHGERNSDGKIYGVVPENPNAKWETHYDEDGVYREYLCCDVYLFTALYQEARLLPGSSQSMEIHREGLDGEWVFETEDGIPYFLFKTGHLLGLQILGEDTEPCFEGSSFFSFQDGDKVIFNFLMPTEKKKEDKSVDRQKFIESILNAEGDKYVCLSVEEKYALVYNKEEKNFQHIAYSIEENEDTLLLGDSSESYLYEVKAEDKAAYDELMQENSFSALQKKFAEYADTIEAIKTEKENYEKQIQELKEENDKLKEFNQSETENYEKSLSEKETEIDRLKTLNSDMNSELTTLREFQQTIMTERKTSVLEEFSNYLSKEEISAFKDKMNDYSVEDFKKDVCFTAYQHGGFTSSTKNGDSKDWIYVGNAKNTENGVLRLLSKHKGGNK